MQVRESLMAQTTNASLHSSASTILLTSLTLTAMFCLRATFYFPRSNRPRQKRQCENSSNQEIFRNERSLLWQSNPTWQGRKNEQRLHRQCAMADRKWLPTRDVA